MDGIQNTIKYSIGCLHDPINYAMSYPLFSIKCPVGSPAISGKSKSAAVTTFEYYWLWNRMPGIMALFAIVGIVTIIIIFLFLVDVWHFITSNSLS